MKTKMIFSGLFGALVGAAVSYFVTKNYYEKLIDKEIQSVKDAFNQSPVAITIHKTGNNEDVDELIDGTDPSQMDVKQYAAYMQKQKKVNYSTPAKPVEAEEKDPIRVIPYAEFRDKDWDCATLYHYADDILADADDVEFDEQSLPDNWRDDYEKYDPEDDTTIYIINEKNEMYYEIIQCPNSFGEDFDDDE